ncbi:hypothetical protein BSL78_07382 [Apostichopus japonicus]|uniref:Uncharacterized protein n=1 Tax=Stichopus japonicus TaxID=307972 RepID=A0A2G8L633_STIJA|nr:hypothetical protein BSL78_07382 [Apostichopus japonicus]
MAQDFRFVALSVGILLLFALTLFVNYLAGAGEEAIIPIFETSIGEVSDKYTTPVTPANWTFAIWGLIYTWQLVLIAYVLSTICRNNANDEPLYKYPPVITYGFLLAYTLNLITNAGWCFFFCNQKMVYALVIIVLSAVTLYVALINNSIRVFKFYGDLYKTYR